MTSEGNLCSIGCSCVVHEVSYLGQLISRSVNTSAFNIFCLLVWSLEMILNAWSWRCASWRPLLFISVALVWCNSLQCSWILFVIIGTKSGNVVARHSQDVTRRSPLATDKAAWQSWETASVWGAHCIVDAAQSRAVSPCHWRVCESCPTDDDQLARRATTYQRRPKICQIFFQWSSVHFVFFFVVFLHCCDTVDWATKRPVLILLDSFPNRTFKQLGLAFDDHGKVTE